MKFNLLDDSFYVGMVIKGVDGILEVIGGVLLLIARPATINHLVMLATQHELVQDPRDFLAHRLLEFGTYLAISHVIAASYLIFHGLLKIGMVYALLKKYVWAYPVGLGLQSVIVLYQIYRIGYTHSVSLTALTIFDLIIMWLIWLEWQKVRRAAA